MANHQNYSKKKQAAQSASQIDGNSTDSHKVVKQGEVENAEEWEKQIWYWRTHLDVFIEEYFSTSENPIRLKDVQKVIARNCGNCTRVMDVESRSMGKTWKMAPILSALSILYSHNRILVVSATVKQSMIVARYIQDLANDSPNLAREIVLPIKISKDGAIITFKNGSTIEARAMNADGSNIRGLREKIIYVDESLLVKTDVIQNVLVPMTQYKRKIAIAKEEEGFEDFKSKIFETSSAYLKACDFYARFTTVLNNMKKGSEDEFACALSYKCGVRIGLVDEEFVEKQKAEMPLSAWEMEWNAKFIGAANGSFFPYDLTEPCRDMTEVELRMPINSKSRYILSMDVATSEAKTADNAALSIIKVVPSPKNDGTFHKYLVYLKTYHGFGQEALALEIRKACIRWKNIEKVIVDFNAIGEGVVALLNFPYVDKETNKEYEPLVPDDGRYIGNNVKPIVRCYRGNNSLNNRAAAKTKLYFENRTLHLPVNSMAMRREQEQENITNDEAKNPKNTLAEEVAVFFEVDALLVECSNIVPKVTTSSTVYDTLKTTQHKDRYSSLSMALEYVSQLEDENRDKFNSGNGKQCWGIAMKF
jgi:hypothetical protein